MASPPTQAKGTRSCLCSPLPQARAAGHAVGCGQAETCTSDNQYKALRHDLPEQLQLGSARRPYDGKVLLPFLEYLNERSKQAQDCANHQDGRERAHRISAEPDKPKPASDMERRARRLSHRRLIDLAR